MDLFTDLEIKETSLQLHGVMNIRKLSIHS